MSADWIARARRHGLCSDARCPRHGGCAGRGECNGRSLDERRQRLSPHVDRSIGRARYTYGMPSTVRDLVVNTPKVSDVDRVEAAGTVSGRQVPRLKELSFTVVRSSKVSSPMIAEYPINLELVVRHELGLGEHDLFIGELVACRCGGKVLDARDLSSFRDELGPVLMGSECRWAGEVVGNYGLAALEGGVVS